MSIFGMFKSDEEKAREQRHKRNRDFFQSRISEALSTTPDNYSSDVNMFLQGIEDDDSLLMDALHYMVELGLDLDIASRTLVKIGVYDKQLLTLLSMLRRGAITSNSPHLQPDKIDFLDYENE